MKMNHKFDKRTFGQALKEARKATRTTQNELSESTGTHQPQISDFEKGKRRVTNDFIELASDHMKVIFFYHPVFGWYSVTDPE